MTPELLLDNLLAHWLQAGAVAGVALLGVTAVRLRDARVQLLGWQALLLLLVLLPFMQLWPPVALPVVEVDREQMRRVLTNLIDNAVAAVQRLGTPGRVELRSLYDAALQSVRLEVSDDGDGIRAEDRRRVFEPYFSTTEKGTGLGLAIVYGVVADTRGYIRVPDTAPRGTRFVIELPVPRFESERAEAATAAAATGAGASR